MKGKEQVIINNPWHQALLFSLGDLNQTKDITEEKDILQIINDRSHSIIRDKNGTTIGARMGRPEKAKMRKLTGSPQVLFPVGKEGGKMRCFQSALELGKITAEFSTFFCGKCQKETIYKICPICKSQTKEQYFCADCNLTKDQKCDKKKEERGQQVPHKSYNYKKTTLDIKTEFNQALNILSMKTYPDIIKGVRGTSNEEHIPEHLVKGILRACYGLYVNKDGTIRYDMTETVVTHFTPEEIGASVEKLKELGYIKDIYNKELKNSNQILEIKPQDIILPSCDRSLNERADDFLLKTTQFIDDLLVKFYSLKKFYNAKKREDLIGCLIVGLSPHTSAGVVGRVIGFSNTQGFYCHPYFHSLMRRDADGDEAGIILLLDCLINFSKKYLPSHRGAKQDEPLVLSTKIIPSEVDDMVFDMDITDRYPLELYQAAQEYKYPWEVKIKTVKDCLNKPEEYEGFLFTHHTSSINKGTVCSSYKSIPTMMEKVAGQMKLAERIRAVNESDVARLLIERHFIRDIKGNLRKFGMQQFRCVDCNEKYRRPPLNGRCKCKGKLIFTVTHGSIVKYLEPCLFLAEKYNLPPYLRQNLQLTKARIESLFGKEDTKQGTLKEWFEK